MYYGLKEDFECEETFITWIYKREFHQIIMSKIATLLTFILLTIKVLGQTETEIIMKSKLLIDSKKYESAFKLLDSFDAKNSKPEVVLLKEEIVLNYFVSSMMHQMFALKDLEKNEDILDYRGKEGSFDMHLFEVDKILDSLIITFPDNCHLYKGRGEYYYEVYLKYGGKWLKDDNELFRLIETDFQKTIDRSCADYLSYYVLGYINLVRKKYTESVPYFLQSIGLNKDYANSHYNLAYAYLYTDDRQKAIEYAKNSLVLYNEQSYKGDAARMLGQTYAELKDDNMAIENYELANRIDPRNYYNLKPLLNLYLKSGNKRTNEIAVIFLNLAPTNPTIYDDLQNIYFNNNKEKELEDFYMSQFSVFKDIVKVQGNLNFYLGRINLTTNKKLAIEYFKKAKFMFSKIYKKDNPVFSTIEDAIKLAEK